VAIQTRGLSPVCSYLWTCLRVHTGPGKPGKSWNFSISFSRPGKSWKLSACHGKSLRIKFVAKKKFSICLFMKGKARSEN